MASYILLTVGICIIFTSALHYIRDLIGWSILDEDWCHYNKVEPNGRSLKQFRWETYKTLPYREQMYIRYPKGYIPDNDIPYQSFDEFPDDFDYMWRY